MKAAPFDYVRVESLEELFSLMGAIGDDALILAGGQSLVPAMAMRMARPRLLLDVNHIPGLSGVTLGDSALHIGALTRYHELAASPEIARHAPLIAAAVPLIAHEAIRSRGTLGGNIAHADPASEMPAVLLALDATIHAESGQGGRTIPACDFFLGTYETALAPGEIVRSVSIPRPQRAERSAIDEVVRRAGDYAMAGAAIRLVAEAGRVAEARIALFGVADRALRCAPAEEALRGAEIAALPIEEAVAALRDALEPLADLHAGAATKRHLAGVVTGRLLAGLQEEHENG
ncbi:xanthine dehydrogenase family protein subunit M [Actibacterium sp. MT2.3-13A]|uniref:FAD binding domain-containing protein n=1 Tax=Actibacterium sp. MT2.3-13A TaxID=2828332 RepID=UPI001BAC2AF0|nr:xanthine dehydrogenase family protein subunit M [Actibacterium sp. MT2.3-13A]